MPKKGFGIEVYLRTRPTTKPAPGFEINTDENYARFEFEKDLDKDYVNNMSTAYQFDHFKQILPMNISQEKVFNTVGRDVVDSWFDGYNGTIFAYGQTASGKTFTITGGAERYDDRGLIPRTLSHIFDQISSRTDTSYKVLISYLELYNDQGYDLLDANHSSKNLLDLPKVQIREDEFGQFMLKNLSVHKADNEEDALNLLFIGDTNRVVSETPMNDASTRSHCIFIIQLEAQNNNEDVKKVSKLQLVDLSGSERASKTGVDGKTLTEAKNINVSLHFLQQVIVNLNEKLKGKDVHVPYRNTKMTMMLKDSIGGNCKTRMIATIHAKPQHLQESLDTCNFARRVSLIQNSAKVNQVSDPAVIIGKLRKEVSELKAEIWLLKGTNDVKEYLDPEDIDEWNLKVESFVKNTDPSATLMFSDRLRINQCFYHFKGLVRGLQKRNGGAIEDKGVRLDDSEEEKEVNTAKNSKEVAALKDFVSKLQDGIKSRDNEIAILIKHANKMKGRSNDIPVAPAEITRGDPEEEKKMTLYQRMTNKNPESIMDTQSQTTGITGGMGASKTTTQRVNEIIKTNPNLIGDVKLDKNDKIYDRTAAFEKYRRMHRKNQYFEETKILLKSKMDEGKKNGMGAKAIKDEIKILTSKIEQLRREKVMKGMVEDGNIMKSDEEDELQSELSKLKSIFQEKYQTLKTLKAEISRLEKQVDRCWKQLQVDFDEWMKTQSQPAPKVGVVADDQVNDELTKFYKARDQIYEKQ